MCKCPGCDEMSCGLPDCDECKADQEPDRLERHINAAEHWLQQADLYAFPNAVRTECLQLASIHAALAQAISAAKGTLSNL